MMICQIKVNSLRLLNHIKKKYLVGQILYSRFECEFFVTEEELRIIRIEGDVCYCSALRIYSNNFRKAKMYKITHGLCTTSFDSNDKMFDNGKYIAD